MSEVSSQGNSYTYFYFYRLVKGKTTTSRGMDVYSLWDAYIIAHNRGLHISIFPNYWGSHSYWHVYILICTQSRLSHSFQMGAYFQTTEALTSVKMDWYELIDAYLQSTDALTYVEMDAYFQMTEVLKYYWDECKFPNYRSSQLLDSCKLSNYRGITTYSNYHTSGWPSTNNITEKKLPTLHF